MNPIKVREKAILLLLIIISLSLMIELTCVKIPGDDNARYSFGIVPINVLFFILIHVYIRGSVKNTGVITSGVELI